MLLRLKALLRNNSFYVKIFQRRINDIRYFIKNLIFTLKHFKINGRELTGNTIYFVIDPKQTHPGLADRLKVICCIYYIAKLNGFNFKLVFDTPFKLSDYLQCNKVDWKCQIDEIQFSYKTSKMLAYNGMGKIPKLSKKVNQYIIYYYIGRDILRANNIPNSDELLRDCYNELFTPSYKLEQAIASCNLEKRSYISVHLRFVNALEKFEVGVYNSLSPEDQLKLISKCLQWLSTIKDTNSKELLVFSDSNKFLSIAKEYGYKVLNGNIEHISFYSDKDSVLKTFLDFYMIGRSAKAYRIISKEMYGTTFSLYASIFGKCPLITLNI